MYLLEHFVSFMDLIWIISCEFSEHHKAACKGGKCEQ